MNSEFKEAGGSAHAAGPGGAWGLPASGTPDGLRAAASHYERVQASMARLVRERDEARMDAELARQLLAYHGFEGVDG